MIGADSLTLIQTKLQRPRLGQDLIQRPHLIKQLNRGLGRKLTLISAQAGAGKTTLMAQWLEGLSQASAWLSLDQHDNDLIVFASYLCRAIQTIFPDACVGTLDLLNAPHAPPPRIITTSLVNELNALLEDHRASIDPTLADYGDLRTSFILALDDYHSIVEPSIHGLLADLAAYLPQGMHLALTSRTDPPLPLAGLRARGEMTELRTADLRFTAEEAGAFLNLTLGRELNRETIDLLEGKTEGWVVGLRLAAFSVRNLPSAKSFAQRFEGASSSVIVDYLLSEVLSQQSPIHQDFLLRTSILDRFNAEICDAILWPGEDTLPAKSHPSIAPSQTILGELSAANLFLIPLDQKGQWFRYHHLFRDLLQHRLKNQHNPEDIADLNRRASRWFEQNGLIDEALAHAFASGNLDRAARIVARQRYKLMNQARWQRLERYLRRFPSQFASQQPDLLMLKAWLLYHHGHYGQLPAALEQLEATLGQNPLPSEAIRHLEGEISALKSLLYYYQTEVERTIVEAEFSVRNTPPELWIVRTLARAYLAGAFLMRGELSRAYEVIYQGVDEEDLQSNAFKATMLVTACNVYWVAADLHGLLDTANQSLEFYDYPYSAEIKGFAHYHLGCAYYHLNDLAAAEEHFAAVVQQPYLNYGDAFAHSAVGLGLTYQAQNRSDEAREVAASAVAHMLETGNTTLLPVTKAFQAELALRQGQLAMAGQWVAQFDMIPTLSPMVRFFRPHLTLVKIWMAHDTPASRQQAADSLDQLKDYSKFTHNTVSLIEVLALLAILRAAEDDEPAALALLGTAIELAQPGGFLRLFLDLGPPIARLLRLLHGKEAFSNYISEILTAFPAESKQATGEGGQPLPAAGAQLEPLTPREMEVLELLAQRLTNKEIAARLVISPGTVKTHTLSIYDKLNAHGRRKAVNKARELNLI